MAHQPAICIFVYFTDLDWDAINSYQSTRKVRAIISNPPHIQKYTKHSASCLAYITAPANIQDHTSTPTDIYTIHDLCIKF